MNSTILSNLLYVTIPEPFFMNVMTVWRIIESSNYVITTPISLSNNPIKFPLSQYLFSFNTSLSRTFLVDSQVLTEPILQ